MTLDVSQLWFREWYPSNPLLPMEGHVYFTSKDALAHAMLGIDARLITAHNLGMRQVQSGLLTCVFCTVSFLRNKGHGLTNNSHFISYRSM